MNSNQFSRILVKYKRLGEKRSMIACTTQRTWHLSGRKWWHIWDLSAPKKNQYFYFNIQHNQQFKIVTWVWDWKYTMCRAKILCTYMYTSLSFPYRALTRCWLLLWDGIIPGSQKIANLVTRRQCFCRRRQFWRGNIPGMRKLRSFFWELSWELFNWWSYWRGYRE